MTITVDAPLMLWDDSARTRLTDPVTSHKAADQSAHGLSELRLHVLELVRQEGQAIGSELNDLYSLRAARNDWPRAAWDSPRKRAGELAADGYLEVIGFRTGSSNTQERIFKLSLKGTEVFA